MTGIEIVDNVWALLNVPALTALLDGRVWKHNRPRNSTRRDVVISIPSLSSNEIQAGYFDVNVYAGHNLKDYYPYVGEPQDTTFPDLALLRSLTEAVLPLLVSQSGFSISPTITGIPIKDADGIWYINIRCSFEVFEGLTHEVSLMLEESESDGYGGSTVELVSAWTGLAIQENIASGSQLSQLAGRYEFNLRCDWLIPLDAVTPVKNMQVYADNGIYVINGIKHETGVWRLSSVRKDGDY